MRRHAMSPRHFLNPGLRCVFALAVFCSANLPLAAQNSQGTILGHVIDASGAVLPGPTVTITNVATSVTNSMKTSAVGDYVFVNVKPGTYTFTCRMKP